jgi:TAG lipase / steryl ester hydrolase / phospholipase A2 / LPA acyltransferase
MQRCLAQLTLAPRIDTADDRGNSHLMSKGRTLSKLYESLESAGDFQQWYEIALRIDERSGGASWRADERCSQFDYSIINDHLRQLQGYRESGSNRALLQFLTESLYRLNHDITRPDLYSKSMAGPKQIIEQYYAEVQRCIRYLCDTPDPDFKDTDKLAIFESAVESFGRTALLLSGGATLGYYHLGVAKALWDQDLLPSVISGSSMGSIIAAAICTRTDEELGRWFDDHSEVDVHGLRANPIHRWRKKGSIFNQDALKKALHNNITHETFLSAYEKTGRVLNISVSPTRHNQKPRVLNYQTAPDALIIQACLASSAVPGLFQPVTLTQLTPDGQEVPYLLSETWVDGSIEGDLPKLRLSRLQNVNHFIVSQTNPHVLPIVRAKSGHGIRAKLVGAGTRFAQVQSGYLLEVCKGLASSEWAKTLLGRTQSFIAQDYEGDINIHPTFRMDLYQLMMKNPSHEQLAMFIREGEIATWPKLAIIKYQTLVARVLDECAQRLRHRINS